MQNRPLALGPVILPDRGRLALTYGLTISEHACVLAYPALTGWAVDGLLNGRVNTLAPLAGVWALHIALSFIRQRYDTRVFTRLYARIASEVVQTQRSRGISLSRLAARTELSREVVDFFEVEVPAIFANMIAIFGSLVALMFYDLRVAAIAAFVLLPVAAINGWFAPRSRRLNRGLNNQIEREVRSLASGSRTNIARHFRLLSCWKIALSDAQSTTWAVTEGVTLSALATVLVTFALTGTAVTAGALYAVITYMLDYLDGLDDVPEVVNNLTRIADIRQRL